MHLALIQPPSLVDRRNYLSFVAIPPLWLGYLTATCREAGYRVTPVDGAGEGLKSIWTYKGMTVRGLDFEGILSRIPADATVAGISCMFSCSWPLVRDLSFEIKKRRPDLLLLIGGEHATALPEMVLQEGAFDIVAKGEGEETLVELLKALDEGQSLRGLAGISYKTPSGDIQHNLRRDRIRGIDSIPPPDWQDIRINDYIAMKSPHGAQRGRSMPMLVSRGCPYRCTFCTSPNMWTTRWEPRSVDLVLDEMQSYMARYGATDFHFEDLTAVIQKSWVLEFSKKVLERGMDISWQLPTGTRSEAFDREIAAAMFASGCKNFAFAIESGDPEVLAKIQKKMRPEKMFKAARASMKEGLRVQALFIFGFPFETPKNILKTYLTILKCAVMGFSEINISAFFPMPGTKEFQNLMEEGKITLSDEYFLSLFDYLSLGRHKSWSPHLSDKALRRLILFGFFSFFALSYTLRPWRLVRELAELLKGKTQSKAFRILRSVLTRKQFVPSHEVSAVQPPKLPRREIFGEATVGEATG